MGAGLAHSRMLRLFPCTEAPGRACFPGNASVTLARILLRRRALAARRRLFRLVCLAGILSLITAALAGAAVSWGKLIEVPGTPVLNVGGSAQVNAISCASARNCVAGGRYTDASHLAHAFVASEQSGVWHNA